MFSVATLGLSSIIISSNQAISGGASKHFFISLCLGVQPIHNLNLKVLVIRIVFHNELFLFFREDLIRIHLVVSSLFLNEEEWWFFSLPKLISLIRCFKLNFFNFNSFFDLDDWINLHLSWFFKLHQLDVPSSFFGFLLFPTS